MSSRRTTKHGISRRDLLRGSGAAVVGATFGGTVVSLAGCIPEGRLKRSFEMTPEARDDGWPIGTPADVGLDPSAVEAAYRRVFSENELPNIRSLLVARHGVLVAEAYIADRADITRVGALMSATKSVTSTLAGIAIDRGELASIDVTIGDLFPDKTQDPAKRAIRLRDALTMRAGIDFANSDFSLEMEYGDANDSVACILGKPLAQPPGTVFKYTDASAHLAGAIVQRAVGKTLDDYAREHLFSGIGIDRFEWLHHRDGLAYGAYGLFLTPRDFLRFGQAVLRAKRHEVGAVVSPAWIDTATTFQVKPTFDTSFDFGLLWWLTPDGAAFTASGHGGQFAYSIPALDLEIVVTADPNSNEDSVSVNVTDAKALADTIASGAV
jgi:CubicO group peptidase (beta-lactamase class C family)